jgi:transketolase
MASGHQLAPARLRAMATTMRRWIIDRSFQSHVGHIGSALSIADLVAVLWGAVLRDPGSASPDRDRFILSKGHACLALYSAMRFCGQLSEEVFATYCGDGTALSAHPEHSLPGIDLSTGSLGQGLSVGCGMAFGLRQKGSPARVYVLLSDAECNEGQVWEAGQFAAHHHLRNLTAVIDWNGAQAMGKTRDILDLSPIADKWRVFGWDVCEADGHDPAALLDALAPTPSLTGRPRMLVAHTMMGKGVSFMEDQVTWHYLNLTQELRDQAMKELEAGPCEVLS